LATRRGKLNFNSVVRLFTWAVAINKNPDRFSDRGFSLLRFSSPLYQSLRFAPAMILIKLNPALDQKTALSGAR
jgi:hypothetical protein